MFNMNKKRASLIFLGVCIVLGILLLTKTITPFVGGSIFAAALIVFGVMSRGFTKGSQKNDSHSA